MVGHLIKTTKPVKNHGSTFDKTMVGHLIKTTKKKYIKNPYFERSKCPTRVFEKLQKGYQGFLEKVGPTRVFSYQGFKILKITLLKTHLILSSDSHLGVRVLGGVAHAPALPFGLPVERWAGRVLIVDHFR